MICDMITISYGSFEYSHHTLESRIHQPIFMSLRMYIYTVFQGTLRLWLALLSAQCTTNNA